MWTEPSTRVTNPPSCETNRVVLTHLSPPHEEVSLFTRRQWVFSPSPFPVRLCHLQKVSKSSVDGRRLWCKYRRRVHRGATVWRHRCQKDKSADTPTGRLWTTLYYTKINSSNRKGDSDQRTGKGSGKVKLT